MVRTGRKGLTTEEQNRLTSTLEEIERERCVCVCVCACACACVNVCACVCVGVRECL